MYLKISTFVEDISLRHASLWPKGNGSYSDWYHKKVKKEVFFLGILNKYFILLKGCEFKRVVLKT